MDSDFIFDQIETIFFELAEENLGEDFFSSLNVGHAKLVCELDEAFSDSWEALLYESPSQDEYVQVSMQLEIGEQKRCVAMFLLSLDFEHEKECHVQWLW